MRGGLSAAFLSALLPVGLAAAQAPASRPDDLVSHLAFDRCPSFVKGEMTLKGDADLTARGFGEQIKSWVHPISGPVEFRSDQLPGLMIIFGGAPGTLCQVNMIGADAPARLAMLRNQLARLPYTFAPDAERSGVQSNGANVETLKATLSDHDFMFVQFIRSTVQEQPMAGFQLKEMKL